jgi:hypothetical protein
MKKLLTPILLGLVFAVMAFTPGCKHESGNIPDPFVSSSGMAENTADTASSRMPATTTVYVCKSTGAKKYHFKENCGGLKRCTHTIVTMTVKEAEGMGLGLCGYED